MSTYKRNVITGAVVLGALIALGWMILTFTGRAMGVFKPVGTPVTFLASHGDGLADGSPVFFNGVEVGKVTSVVRATDNIHIIIGGLIENSPPLPHNLLGDITVQSHLGSATEIELRIDGEPVGTLQANQEITLRYGGNSLLPPEAIELVDQVRRQEMVVHLDQAIIAMHTQIEKFGEVMESVQDVIGDEELRDNVRQALANIRTVTERANRIGENVEKLTVNANATVAKANDGVDHISRQMGVDLEKLGQVFGQLQQVADKINNGKGTAGALVNDPRLYDELTTTVKELNVVAKTLARLADQWEREGVALKLSK